MRKRIHDKDGLYSFLKFFVDWSVRSSYKKYQVEGLENIPEEGSVIWAANHTNALMDPMVLLSSTKCAKVFVARADIFKKPLAKKALTFLRVMPIFRIRDGFDAVKQNDRSIAQATDVILNGVPFIIYPEATHRPKHSLLKLSKGAFHIAESAIEQSTEGHPVYILPIGIEYGDYFRYRSTALVRFAKPMNITEFKREHADLPAPVVMLKMREELSKRMAEQIVYIPDDEDYDATWEYVKLKAANPERFKKALAQAEKENGVKYEGLMRNQAVDKYFVAQVLALKESDPQKASQLFSEIDKFRLWRIQHGVSVYSVGNNKGLLRIHAEMIGLALLFPYALFCAMVSCISWIPMMSILRGIKDDAFYNTVRFATRMGLAVPSLIIWCLIYFLVFPWKIALGLLILSLPSLRVVFDYGMWARMFSSDFKWKFRRHKAPDIENLL